MCVQQLINAGELAPYIGLRPRLTRLLELLAKYAGEKTQPLRRLNLLPTKRRLLTPQ